MINNILKLIQIIMFVLFFTGGLYLIFNSIHIKSKKIKVSLITTGLISMLISSLVMIILSVFIVNNNKLYYNINFPVFQQLWIVVKSILKCYLDVCLLVVLIYGIIFISLLIFKRTNMKNMSLATNSILYIKLSFIEKLMYFNLFYETKIHCLRYNDDVLISNAAYKELQLYIKSHKKEHIDEK